MDFSSEASGSSEDESKVTDQALIRYMKHLEEENSAHMGNFLGAVNQQQEEEEEEEAGFQFDFTGPQIAPAKVLKVILYPTTCNYIIIIMFVVSWRNKARTPTMTTKADRRTILLRESSWSRTASQKSGTPCCLQLPKAKGNL